MFDIPDDRREDPVFLLTHGEGIGRDGCRIPMPWTPDPATSFGFSDRALRWHRRTRPWLPQPGDWGLYAASTQDAPGSMLDLYRKLSVARRTFALPHGLDADIVELGDGLVGLRRGSLLVAMNVTDAPIDVAVANAELMASASVIVSTNPGAEGAGRAQSDDGRRGFHDLVRPGLTTPLSTRLTPANGHGSTPDTQR